MPRVSLALGCALAAGCFNPNPPTGLPCGPGDQCPPGQQCIAGICDGIEPPDDGGDPPFDCQSWRSTIFEPCNLPVRDSVVRIDSDTTINTTDLSSSVGIPGAEIVTRQIDGIDVVFVVGGDIVIGPTATLRLVGARPAVLAAWISLEVRGGVDASGGVLPGAGGNPPSCQDFSSPDRTPDAGGAGGSGRGGVGGEGGPNAIGDPGGEAFPFAAPNRLVGGCSGGSSDPNSNGSVGDGGGAAGGAVLLAARGNIQIIGRVSLNGAGGRGGGSAQAPGTIGGNGGGAGGQLVIEGEIVTIAGAILTANGGGGGGGGGIGGPGGDGASGTASDIRAPGGDSVNGDGGGRGGDGGAGVICDGDAGFPADTMPEAGGGGGGGACGQIEVLGDIDMLDAVISPPIAPMPF